MENQEKFCPLTSIVIGSAWCVFGIIFYLFDVFVKISSKEHGELILICVHIAFFVFFICSLLFSYIAFAVKAKIVAKEKLTEDEYKRKKEWEEFQYGLNKPEREFRQNIEKEKWKNENEKFHFELKKEQEDIEEIKKLKNEKWALEEKLKKYEDAVIAEREKNAQTFHLLALTLSEQNVFTENKTVEEKLRQIEKDYNLLKKTITEIKL